VCTYVVYYQYGMFAIITQTLFGYKMAEVQSKHNYIAVYNYMFRPLSAIVRLYYFLLCSKSIQYARRLLLVTRCRSHELYVIIQLDRWEGSQKHNSYDI